MTEAALARRMRVTEMVRVYEQAKADIVRAFDMINQAQRRVNETFAGSDTGRIYLRDRYVSRFPGFDNIEDVLDCLLRDVWDSLIDRMEIRGLLSVAKAKELDEQIKRGDLPELTVENALAMGQQMHEQLPDMMQDAVREVFAWLRPRRSHYKSNSEYEIPKRVIRESMVEWSLGHWGLHWYGHEPQLRALENVFRMLDGKGTSKGWQADITQAIKACTDRERGEAETEYFRLRMFHNGNLHIHMKRLDLLQELNRVGGGNRLRSRGANGGKE